MRRVMVVAGVVGLLTLGACSTGSGSGTGTSGTGTSGTGTSGTGTSGEQGVTTPANDNPITGPIDRARSVVGQQNAQLGQEEQRTGAEDPTYP